MTVKIIEEIGCFELERAITMYLRNFRPDDIVSISYSGSGYSVPDGNSFYSVMIITKK